MRPAKYFSIIQLSNSRERQENTSGTSGVSLELGGMDIPVEAPMEAPVMTEGGSVDVSV